MFLKKGFKKLVYLHLKLGALCESADVQILHPMTRQYCKLPGTFTHCHDFPVFIENHNKLQEFLLVALCLKCC